MEQRSNSHKGVSALKKMVSTSVIFAAFLVPMASQAEVLGLLAGREATPAKTSDLTVELGIANGDLGDQSYQNIAARVNYRLSPELVLMGTAGIGEYDETDGVPFGLGALYHLSNQRISQKVEIAGKASYHFGDFSVDDVDGEISSIALEVLVSGREPVMDNGLAWYSNVGYQRTTIDFGESGTSDDFVMGLGLVLPTGLGEAYAGVDYIDGATFGLGIRYFVK